MNKRLIATLFSSVLATLAVGVNAESAHPVHPGAGWANIGLFDSGVNYSHPLLSNAVRKQFSTSLVQGETTANDVTHGHGTMVAGVMVANPGGGVNSKCPGCNLMVVRGVKTREETNDDFGFARAAYWLAGSGIQVLNLSQSLRVSGAPEGVTRICGKDAPSAMCTALDFLKARDIMVVAATGNGQGSDGTGFADWIGVPATERSVIAVGGVILASAADQPIGTADQLDKFGSRCFRIDTPLRIAAHGASAYNSNNIPGKSRWAHWNERCFATQMYGAGGSNFCGHASYEPCNSDYTNAQNVFVKGGRVDFAEQSRNVITTMSPGSAYSPGICDDNRSPPTGVDVCTGTSFAAPAVSSTIGLFRSANPLMGQGAVELALRIAASLNDGQNYPGYTDSAGWGVPARDTSIILNVLYRNTIKNHLTPLFALTQADGSTDDVFFTAIPQVAVAAQFGELHRDQTLASASPYVSDARATPVAGYAVFPSERTATADQLPRAAFDVFTMPDAQFGMNMTPLYRLSTVDGCPNRTHKHFYATSIAEVNSMLSQNVTIQCGGRMPVQTSYNYDGIEGFLLAGCPSAFAGCAQPTNAAVPQCINRRYDAVRDRWDLFTKRDLPASNNPPNPLDACIGYSFVNTDSDGDTLIDGQELVIGTNPSNPNTDGDLVNDGQEFPINNIPKSDPLDVTSM